MEGGRGAFAAARGAARARRRRCVRNATRRLLRGHGSHNNITRLMRLYYYISSSGRSLRCAALRRSQTEGNTSSLFKCIEANYGNLADLLCFTNINTNSGPLTRARRYLPFGDVVRRRLAPSYYDFPFGPLLAMAL
ncbi:hypothetical protein EVAR_47436_1 [Eumeta japonica]|uniref:Uncharacterized protein n=1 Tax=Eumeta variegata TaxID=151549 RepID=A0A4C1XBD0_EUMVA|nr:hypothetical protein EVAR_47436_1 [Eumeta japonica]